MSVSRNLGLHLGLWHDSCGQALESDIFRVDGMHILELSVVGSEIEREEAKVLLDSVASESAVLSLFLVHTFYFRFPRVLSRLARNRDASRRRPG